jgi:hypothetical protein
VRRLCRHHHDPTLAMQPAGQDPKARLVPGTGHTTAPFKDECQSFLDNVIAGLGQVGAWNKLARSAGASPAQIDRSGPPGGECCVRRQRCRTRSVHSCCLGCGSEPRNHELAGAETVICGAEKHVRSSTRLFRSLSRARRSASGPDSRDPSRASRARDIYIPDLHTDILKLKSRNFQ